MGETDIPQVHEQKHSLNKSYKQILPKSILVLVLKDPHPRKFLIPGQTGVVDHLQRENLGVIKETNTEDVQYFILPSLEISQRSII